MELFVIKNLYLGTEKLLFIMKLLIIIKDIPVIHYYKIRTYNYYKILRNFV